MRDLIYRAALDTNTEKIITIQAEQDGYNGSLKVLQPHFGRFDDLEMVDTALLARLSIPVQGKAAECIPVLVRFATQEKLEANVKEDWDQLMTILIQAHYLTFNKLDELTRAILETLPDRGWSEEEIEKLGAPNGVWTGDTKVTDDAGLVRKAEDLNCDRFLRRYDDKIWDITRPFGWKDGTQWSGWKIFHFKAPQGIRKRLVDRQTGAEYYIRQHLTEICPLSKLAQLALRNCLDVTTFNERMAKISPAELQEFDEELRSLDKTTFDLGARNNINMSAFSDALSNGALPKLEVLFLHALQFGVGGMKAFSSALSSGALASLRRLQLQGNQIGDEGMQAFSTALSSGMLASLQYLHLHINEIGDEGMKAFSTALESGALASLTTLDLSENPMSNEGMKAFLSAVSSGALASLVYLDIHDLNIGEEITALSKILTSGALRSLRTLIVDDGPMGTEHPALKAICEVRGIRL